MLPASNLGDRFGRKRFLVGSLFLFGAASLWCALSTSTGELITARTVLGLAGAALLPLGFAMLPILFPDKDKRAKAVTMWTLASALGLPLGPIVGGWLLDHFWWGSVFILNVPLCVIGAIALIMFLPESRSERPVALDVPGTLLSSVGLGGLIFGFIEADTKGWGTPMTWIPIIAGSRCSRRSRGGRSDRRTHSWNSRSSNTVASRGAPSRQPSPTSHSSDCSSPYPNTSSRLTERQPLGTGIRLLPMIGGMLVGTQISARLVKKIGTGLAITIGFLLTAASLGFAATTSVSTGYGFAAAWIAVLGLGIGLALPAAMTAALSALSVERAGAGSGLIQAVRQVGGTIGVAVLGTVLGSGYRSRVDVGHLSIGVANTVRESVSAGIEVGRQLHDEALIRSVQVAFVHGMNLTLLVSGALTFIGAALALRFLPRGPASKEAAPIEPASELTHE